MLHCVCDCFCTIFCPCLMCYTDGLKLFHYSGRLAIRNLSICLWGSGNLRMANCPQTTDFRTYEERILVIRHCNVIEGSPYQRVGTLFLCRFS